VAADGQEKSLNIMLGFDLRAPDLGTSREKLYAEALKMCEWADTRGISFLNVMEHHGSEDGYMPTPFVFGAAVAARTQHAKIVLGAVVLPLHDPVKVAEQIAVTDIISNGRLRVTFGAGYALNEFAMFRCSISDRARLLDEGIPLILRALSGERFVEGGREIFVRPLPLQSPRDIIVVGGGVPAAAKRAARLGLGIMPMPTSGNLIPLYKDECIKLGIKPGPVMLGCTHHLHVSEDPDRAWAQVSPHVMHVVRSYAKFSEGTTSSSPFQGPQAEEKVRRSGFYKIVTPDEAVTLVGEAAKAGSTYFMMDPLIGGLDPDVGWESLQLMVNKVMPRLPSKDTSAH
jgi:alkanesulfonate monooxygenase SsuD/methylene tetrahydromethanopterin reductase-like flavin-dependent oxidoreductase (luciferase family)